jgi:hypothetical protein
MILMKSFVFYGKDYIDFGEGNTEVRLKVICLNWVAKR